MNAAPWQLTLSEASRQIEAQRLSPVDLLASCLERIGSVDGALRAVASLDRDGAIQAAEMATRDIAKGRYRGPLHGIPVAFKDLIDVESQVTSANSYICDGSPAKEDAFVVGRLRAAGAIILGKLNTDEFALGAADGGQPLPPVHNPWNLDRAPGGSSTGSAAAIGGRLLPAALGTDTGGSIRRPAAWCGVVGLKPTYGRISRRGIIPLAPSLDHVGTFTRAVEDAAILFNVMAGPDVRDPTTAQVPVVDCRASLQRGVKGLRIGFVRHYHEQDPTLDPAVMTGMSAAAAVFQDLGAQVEDVELPTPASARAAFTVITLAEAYAFHAESLVSRWNEYGSLTRHRFAVGAFLSAADYLRALHARREIADAVSGVLRRFDVLLSATAANTAVRFNSAGRDDLLKGAGLTSIFNLSGHPAISVPAGFARDGMPFGLHLAARYFDEETLLVAAHAYEQATNWGTRLPPH